MCFEWKMELGDAGSIDQVALWTACPTDSPGPWLAIIQAILFLYNIFILYTLLFLSGNSSLGPGLSVGHTQ